jgi:Flp pilus assembly protein TadD, contains TPR repeats
LNYNIYFKEKLSKLLFLEINKNGFLNALKITNVRLENEDLYLPISPDYLAKNIERENKMKNLPIYEFIEGMSFALGADKNLKYNEDYKVLLLNIKDSSKIIKSRVAEKVKENKLDDAYIMLRGLSQVDSSDEIFTKLLSLGEAIREADKEFVSIFKEDIDRYRKINSTNPMTYLYDALIYKDDSNYNEAYNAFKEYFELGGEKNDVIIEIYQNIEDIIYFEEGKALIENKPEEALKKLLPLIDRFGDDATLFYYIALCYRKVNNFEKAIYYLNESLALDSAIVETVNEMGINLASIGDYDNAIRYFRKAFEATRDVEICTNLIMSYINSGDLKQAKLHLEIAEKINKDDEIVKQLKDYINNLAN